VKRPRQTKDKRKKRPGEASEASKEQRAQILGAFSARAKRAGIRAVVMSELAAELRMSMTTLYEHFSSKEQLVAAMVDHWCEEIATHDVLIEGESVPIRERFAIWGDAWSGRIIQYTPAFWGDLSRDYPKLWARLQADLTERKAKGAALLRPHLKPGLIPAAAFALLELIYTHAHDPRMCDQIGVARRDVIRNALAIWADGALKKR
jgi:AcrR family transcriptional regulator